MGRTLFIRDADEPGRFLPRPVEVLHDVRIGQRTTVAVAVDPPLDDGRRVLFSRALLLPRSRMGSAAQLHETPLSKPVAVLVYAMVKETAVVPDEMEQSDLWMAMWGLVGETPESLRVRP